MRLGIVHHVIFVLVLVVVLVDEAAFFDLGVEDRCALCSRANTTRYKPKQHDVQLISPHQNCPWELSCAAMPRPLALFYTSYRDAKHMIQSILRTTFVFAVKAPVHRRLRRDQRRLAESRAGVPATSARQMRNRTGSFPTYDGALC